MSVCWPGLLNWLMEAGGEQTNMTRLLEHIIMLIMAVFRWKDSRTRIIQSRTSTCTSCLDFFWACQKFWHNLPFTSASWLESSSAKCWKRRRNTSKTQARGCLRTYNTDTVTYKEKLGLIFSYLSHCIGHFYKNILWHIHFFFLFLFLLNIRKAI